MAERESPFADEWRDCLREHYKHVIKSDDTSTEETLAPILHQIGFREAELHELRIHAKPDEYNAETAKVLGDSAADEAANGASEGMTFKVHPAECTCAACMDTVLEAGHDADGQPLEFPEEPAEGAGNVFQVVQVDEATEPDDAPVDDSETADHDAAPDRPDDSPKQRSLF